MGASKTLAVWFGETGQCGRQVWSQNVREEFGLRDETRSVDEPVIRLDYKWYIVKCTFIYVKRVLKGYSLLFLITLNCRLEEMSSRVLLVMSVDKGVLYSDVLYPVF